MALSTGWCDAFKQNPNLRIDFGWFLGSEVKAEPTPSGITPRVNKSSREVNSGQTLAASLADLKESREATNLQLSNLITHITSRGNREASSVPGHPPKRQKFNEDDTEADLFKAQRILSCIFMYRHRYPRCPTPPKNSCALSLWQRYSRIRCEANN